MITKQNYFSQVSNIDYKSLPDALKEGYDTIKFGSKDYSTWEFLEDDQEFLDVYFNKLNVFLEKEKDAGTRAEKAVKKVSKTAKSQPERKPNYKGLKVEIRPASKNSTMFIVWDVKTNQKFANEKFSSIEEARQFIEDNEMILVQPKKQNAKKKTKKATESDIKTVEKVHEEIRFIKRYALLNGKEKNRSQILAFINSLQKAITEKRIRKTSPYAEEIIHIQDQLVKCYNKMGDVVQVNIAKDTVEKYLAIAGGEKTMMSVLFIKRYISLHGKANVKTKAEALLKQMKKAADKKKLTIADPYKEKLELIFNSLNEYIAGKTETPTIQKAELNGLKEMALAKLFAKKKA